MAAKATDQPQLDPLLHQPVRTRMAAFLAARGTATFTEIKRALDLSDGNLEAHMKKLVASDYVETTRLHGEGRAQTVYALTPAGREAVSAYVQALAQLMGDLAPAEVSLDPGEGQEED
jgi:predicted ArsR family transcriptional regulator